MALSACNPRKLPEPEFLDWPEPMQVSSMLDDWCTAVSLPSLSDSQTNCQWMIQTPPGQDGICSARRYVGQACRISRAGRLRGCRMTGSRISVCDLLAAAPRRVISVQDRLADRAIPVHVARELVELRAENARL
jgi:hypothetical protein